MPELTRWNDDRLDDLARQVLEAQKIREDLSAALIELGRMRERLGTVSGDTHDCITELRDFKAQFERREQRQHDERKSDRKWMIGTMLVVAGLVISALAVFLG